MKLARVLYLSFYFSPDAGPGAFRNGIIVDELAKRHSISSIHVITTMPQRLMGGSEAIESAGGKVKISKIDVQSRLKGSFGQVVRFYRYQKFAREIVKASDYDLVFASSSRLGTALLGAILARRVKAVYYLDLRDLFIETIGDFLPQWYYAPLRCVLSVVNKFAVRAASRINVLSSAFVEKVSRINKMAEVRCVYHGVDVEFVNVNERFKAELVPCDVQAVNNKVLLYAGNFGFGQGLEHIIPDISALLPSGWEIHLYGDGPRKDAVLENVAPLNNVKVFSVVERSVLPRIYARATVLFLSLNSTPAFQSSLPSKIFEYCASGKPVIAVGGTKLHEFIRQNNLMGVYAIEHQSIDLIPSLIAELDGKNFDRMAFFYAWRRDVQTKLLVDDIIDLALGSVAQSG